MNFLWPRLFSWHLEYLFSLFFFLSNILKDNLLQTSLAQERARWKKEEESVRSKAVEAAVAIAEVKWLEEEQKKVSEAVEGAMQTARETWQEEKKRDIGIKSLYTSICYG